MNTTTNVMRAQEGWHRVGVLLSGLWIVAVLAYTGYEFHKFPLSPSGALSFLFASKEPWMDASGASFVFVGTVESTVQEQDRALAEAFRQGAASADTKEFREENLRALNTPQWRSGLLPLFYVALIGGPVAFWILTYMSVFLFNWVREGFRKS